MEYDQSFLATWGIYPKRNGQKRGKKQAFDEWKKIDLEDQRLAYADIKARNLSGGWEYVRDMERYLKHRGWDDEWRGQKVTSDPDLIDRIATVSLEQLVEHVMVTLHLCEHQIQRPWTYFGPEPGLVDGAVIPACKQCNKPQHKMTTADVPA